MSEITKASYFGDKAFGLILGVSVFNDSAYSKSPLPQAINDAEDLALRLQESLGWKTDHWFCCNDYRHSTIDEWPTCGPDFVKPFVFIEYVTIHLSLVKRKLIVTCCLTC
jgi:hypothetical protein